MAIRKKDLDIAIAEATRFLSAAKDMRVDVPTTTYTYGSGCEVYEGGPLAAYVKRASMDLTRALAKVRSTGY